VLIDTSVKSERNALLKTLKKYNIDKLSAIFLTHSHTDHAANAKYLSDVYKCTVYVFEKGLNNIKNGICSIPKGTSFFGKTVCYLSNRTHFYNFGKFDACENTEALTEDAVKYYLGANAKLFYTPGHTQDSVSIIVNNKIAVIGDCGVNFLSNKYPPFADDENLLKRTWVN
jgi:glyoxylase-like metal-dependent hydrolase (beta-lactamase superfamily II)